ncbi:MAG: signal recognition particle protein [Pseudonocardiales bacterium]|nr:MAG: signal recognition particle protein [Pseudonocardiales bacterium]
MRLRARLSRSQTSLGRGLLSVLSRENLDDQAWDEVEEALLTADVGVGATSEIVERLRTRTKVLGTRSQGELRALLADELVTALQPDLDRSLHTLPTSRRPAVVLVVGVNGTGKTTTIGKLAWHLRHALGYSVVIGAADTFRAAAVEQLEQWAQRSEATFVSGPPGADPGSVAYDAVVSARDGGADVVIVDTAGRLQLDDKLMIELEELKSQLGPVEILFVADAMTGQDAVKSAEEFHKRLGITGVILTKMDGDARGGAALSIRHVTGQPLKFVGVGEKPDAFEQFHPDRAAQRILGMGDILSFIEKAEEAIDKKKAVEMQQKLLDNEFTLDDFRDQIRQLRKLGPLESMLSMMPQVGILKDLKNVKVDEGEMNRVVAIIDSMTPRERVNHMLINGSRRRRIAKGSGTSVQDVNQLLKQYTQARKMMKSFSGGGFLGKKLGKMKLPVF